MNIPSYYSGLYTRWDFGCDRTFRKGHDNSSSPPIRQSWRVRSAHHCSRWRLWFYSHGRLRPYTFTWISRRSDVSLRNFQLTLLWKVYTLPARLLPERALLLTRDEPGQYRALEWHEGEQKYKENPRMGVLVEVTVCTLPLRQKTELVSLTKTLPSSRMVVAFCRK